jgi:hypothetical protein
MLHVGVVITDRRDPSAIGTGIKFSGRLGGAPTQDDGAELWLRDREIEQNGVALLVLPEGKDSS